MCWGVVAVGASIIGGIANKRAADKATNAQNAAQARADAYNREAYELGKEKLRADHAHMKETIDLKKRNEQRTGQYLDNVNNAKWNYDLQIRNAEQASNQQQFVKSEQLYNQHVSLNEQSAVNAIDQEMIRMEEMRNEFAFENHDLEIEALVKSGQIIARGGSGRSAAKAVQSELAAYGRGEAIMEESFLSGTRSVHSALKEIATDKRSANLSAFANKMLAPGQLPIPPKPFKTPVAEFHYPRDIQNFDFGPEPVGGYMAPSTGWLSFASTVSSGVAGVAGAYIGR